MIRWFKRGPASPEDEAYRNAFRQFRKRDFQPEAGPLVVIDTETTGFQVGEDRMLSVGIMEIREGAIQMRGSTGWLIRHEEMKLNESVKVHGIVPADLEEGMAEIEVMRELLPYLYGSVVVGHHVRFDARMLGEALGRHFGIKWRNPLIDTAHLAMRELSAFHRTGYANQPPPTLDDVCSQLSIYPMERHSAWGDAFTTAEIYLLLCARMRQRMRRSLRWRDVGM